MQLICWMFTHYIIFHIITCNVNHKLNCLWPHIISSVNLNTTIKKLTLMTLNGKSEWSKHFHALGSTLQFQCLPAHMATMLASFCILCLNAFLTKNGISKHSLWIIQLVPLSMFKNIANSHLVHMPRYMRILTYMNPTYPMVMIITQSLSYALVLEVPWHLGNQQLKLFVS